MVVERKRDGFHFVLCFLMGIYLLTTPVLAADAGIRVMAVTDAGEKKTLQLYSGYHALVIGCSAYTSG